MNVLYRYIFFSFHYDCIPQLEPFKVSEVVVTIQCCIKGVVVVVVVVDDDMQHSWDMDDVRTLCMVWCGVWYACLIQPVTSYSQRRINRRSQEKMSAISPAGICGRTSVTCLGLARTETGQASAANVGALNPICLSW